MPQAPNEVAEQPLRMPAWLENSTQSLSDECARVVHALRHGEASDRDGDAKEVLGALQQVKASLDGVVASTHMLWTWQDLLKVCQRVRCPYTHTTSPILVVTATRYTEGCRCCHSRSLSASLL